MGYRWITSEAILSRIIVLKNEEFKLEPFTVAMKRQIWKFLQTFSVKPSNTHPIWMSRHLRTLEIVQLNKKKYIMKYIITLEILRT